MLHTQSSCCLGLEGRRSVLHCLRDTRLLGKVETTVQRYLVRVLLHRSEWSSAPEVPHRGTLLLLQSFKCGAFLRARQIISSSDLVSCDAARLSSRPR